MIYKMMVEEVIPPNPRSDTKYTRVDSFRRRLLEALFIQGKGQVIWTKSSPMQPEKLRQIIVLDGKKYMIHFWKNKVSDIF